MSASPNPFVQNGTHLWMMAVLNFPLTFPFVENCSAGSVTQSLIISLLDNLSYLEQCDIKVTYSFMSCLQQYQCMRVKVSISLVLSWPCGCQFVIFNGLIYNEEPSSCLLKELIAKYKIVQILFGTFWFALCGFVFKVIMNWFQWRSPVGINDLHVKLACMSLCCGRKPVPAGNLHRQTYKSLVWARSQIQEPARAAGQMATSGFIRGGGSLTIRKTCLILQQSLFSACPTATLVSVLYVV